VNDQFIFLSEANQMGVCCGASNIPESTNLVDLPVPDTIGLADKY